MKQTNDQAPITNNRTPRCQRPMSAQHRSQCTTTAVPLALTMSIPPPFPTEIVS